jgi:hypothetical protein
MSTIGRTLIVFILLYSLSDAQFIYIDDWANITSSSLDVDRPMIIVFQNAEGGE